MRIAFVGIAHARIALARIPDRIARPETPAARVPGIARISAPAAPTTRVLAALLAVSFLAVAPSASFGDTRELQYVNVSPTGTEFPRWDGGRTELEFADIDGDGHIDLLSVGDHGSPYVNTEQHGIMVYFSDGAGGWSIHQEGNFGYGGIAIGDVNNDGLLDVGYGIHHDYSGTDFGDQLIEVALGDGTGRAWTPWDDGLATNGETYGMFATDFADIDNDGDLDLASLSFGCCNGVHVYRNNGDGTWTPTWARTGGNARAFLTFGDVNGDGFPDIATSYQNGAVFIGDGEGNFTLAVAGLPPGGSLGLGGISLGDVDGDGKADIAFVQSGGVFVYLWRDGSWESSSAGLPQTGNYEATQLWDMDLDGNVDVVAMGRGTCSIWLGDGAGGWTPGGGLHQGGSTQTQAFRVGGDVDHNGFPDIAFVQEEGSWPSYRNKLYVFKEAGPSLERRVVWQFPRGNETFYIGSVQTLRWSAARVGSAPASVRIEISVSGPEGPWAVIGDGLPESGHRQWTVTGTPTSAAHVRITLAQDGESVAAISRPFRLLSSDPASAAEFPPAGATRLAAFPHPVTDRTWFVTQGERTRLVEDSGAAGATLRVHDPSGRLVRTLRLSRGSAEWDGRDDAGRRVPAGSYMVGGAGLSSLRVVVIR